MAVIVSGKKQMLGRVLDACGLLGLAGAARRASTHASIRIAYYHDVTRADAPRLDAQLATLCRLYHPATRQDLERLVFQAAWPYPRPGLIVTFDDGLRSHAEIVAPLLEKHGMQGWFFVPIALLEAPSALQPQLARQNLVLHANDVSRDTRVFLTVAQLRDLARRHVIGCHTANHVRLRAALGEAELHAEIVDARRALETALQQPVDSFSWVGGEEWACSAAAARLVAEQFRLSFTTSAQPVRAGHSPWQLDRTHLEADFPDWLVRLQLSGLMDLHYAAKRRRLRPLLTGHRPADTGMRLHELLQDAPPGQGCIPLRGAAAPKVPASPDHDPVGHRV
jgi:peptidoglycan/xylan/chitin deacetylase (PgdA/CDA1 family)